jgi:hypothetical protein
VVGEAVPSAHGWQQFSWRRLHLHENVSAVMAASPYYRSLSFSFPSCLPVLQVRLGDWLEFHRLHRYNGVVGIVVEQVDEGTAENHDLRDVKSHRVFAKYDVRVPVIKVGVCCALVASIA